MNRKGLYHRNRIGKRILDIWGRCTHYFDDVTPKRIGMTGTTPKMCSCWMCCNARRSAKGKAKLTRKEQLQILDMKEGMV